MKELEFEPQSRHLVNQFRHFYRFRIGIAYLFLLYLLIIYEPFREKKNCTH